MFVSMGNNEAGFGLPSMVSDGWGGEESVDEVLLLALYD